MVFFNDVDIQEKVYAFGLVYVDLVLDRHFEDVVSQSVEHPSLFSGVHA